MTYCLQGHDFRTAAEEMLLHLLPAESVRQCEKDDTEGDSCVSELTVCGGMATATAHIRYGGRAGQASRSASLGNGTALARKRIKTELVRLSIYDALCPMLPTPPVWGSLTGVRPAKLARNLLARGMTRPQAAAYLREHYGVSRERTALTMRAAAVAQDVEADLAERDIALYVGIPFCPSRCAYCSFVSADVAQFGHWIAPYLDALCEEIAHTGELLHRLNRRLVAVYIGGGTPTTLTAEQLQRLMEALQKGMDVSHVTEYTVEAGRPDTVTAEKLQAIRAGGATRISINPQTMNDDVLRIAKRPHTAQQVLEACALARQTGFSVINMDLIAGLSGDTSASFAWTIEQLLALAPENITVHTLAIKRAADLSDKKSALSLRETVGEMLDTVSRELPQAGYAPYYLYRQKFSAGGFENVGWCKPDMESRYNVMMMEEIADMAAVGAGGVSKRCDRQTGKITRAVSPKYPKEYIEAGERLIIAKEKLLHPAAETKVGY